MGETKPLSDKAAIEKMKHIASDQIAMLCTASSGQAMSCRPMGTQQIDEQGTFWFMSQDGSTKNREIEANPSVQLIYSSSSNFAFLCVQGTAEISRDRKKIEELWNPFAKNWFPEGKADPKITLIKFTPVAGHYWDTKHNKMVTLVSIAIGSITGKMLDDGVQGSLKI